jgi:hypothetical protein
MPSLSINYNPAVGPLISVGIFSMSFSPQQMAGASQQSPLNVNNYMTLIDTGASHTAISSKVISDLNLKPMGKQSVGGVHGQQQTNLYQFQVGLIFPQTQLASGSMQANIVSIPTSGTEFVNTGMVFDVLLGRDIICKGCFTMSFDGHAFLSI